MQQTWRLEIQDMLQDMYAKEKVSLPLVHIAVIGILYIILPFVGTNEPGGNGKGKIGGPEDERGTLKTSRTRITRERT